MPWVGIKFRVNVKDTWAAYLFSPSSSDVEILSPTLGPRDLMRRAYGRQLCQMSGVFMNEMEVLIQRDQELGALSAPFQDIRQLLVAGNTALCRVHPDWPAALRSQPVGLGKNTDLLFMNQRSVAFCHSSPHCYEQSEFTWNWHAFGFLAQDKFCSKKTERDSKDVRKDICCRRAEKIVKAYIFALSFIDVLKILFI